VVASEPIFEPTRTAWSTTLRLLASLRQDVSYGARLLRRAPGFTLAAVLTIALGVGATTAIYSVVYGVLLRPLPFRDPDRLVALWTRAPRMGLPRALVGAANARDWREQNRVFEDIALMRTVGNFNLTGHGEPVRLLAGRISANLLPVLGVTPLLGRGFTEDEDDDGRHRVVLLSHGLWQRRFGADASVVGRSISLSGVPHVVVGVMAPQFQYPSRDFEIWVPLTINPADYVTRSNHSFVAVARLRGGVSVSAAQADLDVVSARLAAQHPATNQDLGVEVVPLHEDTVATVRRPLWVLLAAAGAMLLIACANLANLLLSRALSRRKELAVRASLGAARRRLVAQSVLEVVPLLALGGLAGLVVAQIVLGALVPLLPSEMPRAEGIGLSVPVLLGALATLAGVGLLAGAGPGLEAARHSVAETAAELSRATAAPGRARARDVLVAAQIALTLVLGVGATLLFRSLGRLRQVDPGFAPARVVSAHLAIPRQKYGSDTEVARFCTRVLERVRALPGVQSAAMVNRLPLAGGIQVGGLELEGVDPARLGVPSVDWRTVTPGYFETMAIPLREGRDFSEADAENAPLVGLIDERLARAAWPGQSALGRRFRQVAGSERGEWTTIVGVVGHVRHDRLDEDSRPQVYWTYLQRAQDRMALAVKARGEPDALAGTLAALVRAVDPEQAVYDVRTLEAVVDRSLAPRSLQTMLVGVFAGLALLLASVGVYGVMAYAVGQRRREFGIRLALGARRADVVRLVFSRGAGLFACGASVGLLGAALAARVLGSLLYEVAPLDPVSFAAATGVILAASLLACGAPARRAASMDPTVALRAD
jgi:putative ABC transport system permease protein